MYKSVSIVYNQPLSQVQGINYVNNSFVVGANYFKRNGFFLKSIYGPETIFDCTKNDSLNLIGANLCAASYKRKRKVRVLLRNIFSSKCLLGASVKIFFNFKVNAKKAVRRISQDNNDYLIFQDINSVNEYFKIYKKKHTVKTILILHCSRHPLEQFISTFPGYFRYGFLKQKAFKQCEKAMNMVDKVVYLSEFAEAESALPKEKKTHIYNGVEDLPDIRPTNPSKPLQFVCVASVTYHKGQLNIIEALSLLDITTLSKIHFTLVGGGNEYEECKQLVNNKGLQNIVTLTGQRNDVPAILKRMDVFILPSISEGMPMSILEAMRQGLYIMATPVGGIPEMIDNSFGEFITREPEELAKSIKGVVENSKVTLHSKQLARRRYLKDFTLFGMINRYSEVLESL